MIAGLRRHKNFLVYGTWSALLNTASQQLPVLLLAFYFSPKIVGFFALGKTVLSIPLSIVGGAVSQVFFQKASEAHNRSGNLSKVVEEVFKRLVSSAFSLFCCLHLSAKKFLLSPLENDGLRLVCICNSWSVDFFSVHIFTDQHAVCCTR